MSFVSTLNTSDVTDNINLMTPEIHTLLNRLALSDVDSINFTSYDILVCRSSVLQFLFFLCVFSFSWFYFLELLPVESGPQKWNHWGWLEHVITGWMPFLMPHQQKVHCRELRAIIPSRKNHQLDIVLRWYGSCTLYVICPVSVLYLCLICILVCDKQLYYNLLILLLFPSGLTHTHTHAHTHNPFAALFPGPPRWAVARRELLDFMVHGKINRGRHTDRPAGRTPSGLTSAHLHHPTILQHWLHGLFTPYRFFWAISVFVFSLIFHIFSVHGSVR